jgi:hypothetical protein
MSSTTQAFYDAIPRSTSIRTRLAELSREQRLLRSMLRLAVQKEGRATHQDADSLLTATEQQATRPRLHAPSEPTGGGPTDVA